MPSFLSTTPVQVSRSRRVDRARGVTTAKAGKVIPLRYIPLLREDRLSNTEVSITVEMAETVRPLRNAVYLNVEAWFVPFAAFEQFAGIDDFNRAYAKVVEPGTSTVKPFMSTAAFAANDIWNKLGVHGVPGAQVNLAPIQAYNTIINHMRKDRSPNLPVRTETDTSLAVAFWEANRFAHVVPNYDRSLIDGVVPLEAPTGLKITGMGIQNAGTSPTSAGRRVTGGTLESGLGWAIVDTGANGGANNLATVSIQQDPNNVGYPNIRAVVDGGAVHISLANIDLARQTAAFDALRKKYAGHDDDEIIELLMEGIRVPEYMERMPMLLAAQKTAFNFATRYASDGPNLDESVTNGVASLRMRLSMPATNTGGIVMVVGSAVPDQMHERRRDNFIATVDHDNWPKYERDSLDIEKVDNVLNCDVDISHATPAGIFGYEPMNYRWNRDFIRLGGDLYRPSAATPWDEDRAVLWVSEPVNPTLTADFYLATAVNADPFADKLKDHLTFTVIHNAMIEGNTVFGPPLLEVIPGNQ